MLAQSVRTADLRILPPRPNASTEPRVAVLINRNARSVSARVVKSLSHVVPDEDLFVSHSELDVRRIVETVLDRRYPTVFFGGGDGTFVWFVNEIFRQLEQRSAHHPQRPPKFGILRLGTGNALANVVCASSIRGDRILDDVLRARAGEIPGYRRIDLLRVDGQRTVFAGMGVDGKIINDYNWVKDHWGRGALKKVLSGPAGYVTSVALKTVPHYFTHSTWTECEVINGASPAYALAADGSIRGEPLAPGAVLYRGRLNLAAAATIPFFGFGMRAFPFAGQRRGMMHLRLAAVSTGEVLTHLPTLWKGRWFPSGILEFHTNEATIHFGRPMPVEIGGDAAGYRTSVKLDIAPDQVELVDYTGTVH